MDVFISFAHEDESDARIISEKLDKKGISNFLAPKTLRTGESFEESIRNKLQGCKALFLLLTPNSLRSEWVTTESGAAWALEKHIFPILLRCRPNELPARLSKLQCKDYDNLDEIIEEYNGIVGINIRKEIVSPNTIEGERLDTTEEQFKRLCLARSRCKSILRLMQIRARPPVAIDNGKVVLEGKYPKLLVNDPSVAKWYNELPNWIGTQGHQGERITISAGDSITYARFVDEQMKQAGGIWETYIIKDKLAGLPPYNFCIFDESELTITFGIPYGPNGRSIWIRDKKIVGFYLSIYEEIRSTYCIPLYEFDARVSPTNTDVHNQ